MPDAHSPFHAPVGSDTQTSGFGGAMPEGVRQLFDEVDALALRLRQSERLTVSEDDSVIAGQHVLQILAEKDGQTVPQIARVRATSRQNIQIVVNRLKVRGCVEVLGNPAHKRSPLVRLTDRGRDLLTKAMAEHEKLRAGIASRISGKDIDEMLKTLRRVRELLGAQPTPAKAAKSSQRSLQKPSPVKPQQIPVGGEAITRPVPPAEADIDDNELPVSLL